MLFAGTVTQAGMPSRLPVDEDAPDDPITVYDRHKLIAEEDLKTAAAQGIVRGATLRLANVYGPGGHGRKRDRDVLNRMIKTAIAGGPLTVFGTGEYLRDYVFVEDVVDAFLMAAVHPEQVNRPPLRGGSGRGISIRDAFELVAARVERLTGRHVPVTTTEPAAPRVADRAATFRRRSIAVFRRHRLAALVESDRRHRSHHRGVDVRVVVTGALGHIGSRLIRELAVAWPGIEIVMLDNLATERYASLYNLPGGLPIRVRGGRCPDRGSDRRCSQALTRSFIWPRSPMARARIFTRRWNA